MTKKYLDGEMSRIDYELDLPYEVDKRYQTMYKVVLIRPPGCLMRPFTN